MLLCRCVARQIVGVCISEVFPASDFVRIFLHFYNFITGTDSLGGKMNPEPPSNYINTSMLLRVHGKRGIHSATVLYPNSASPKPGKRRRATLIIFIIKQCR